MGLKAEYKNIVKTVCKVSSLRDLSANDKHGAYGVAMLLAFLKGVKPSLEDFSKHLGISKDRLSLPYSRLLTNGIFSQSYAASEDPVLLGLCESTKWISSSDRTRNAWAIIAGIASGHTGLREDK